MNCELNISEKLLLDSTPLSPQHCILAKAISEKILSSLVCLVGPSSFFLWKGQEQVHWGVLSDSAQQLEDDFDKKKPISPCKISVEIPKEFLLDA